MEAQQLNAEAIEAWNGILFQKFNRFRYVMTTGLAGHGDENIRRHPPAESARVLDVGCGFGDSVQQLARLVGPRGEVVGVDCAANFIELGRSEAERDGVRNVRFLVADVQTEPLGGPYDHVFSRFGTMFFASPVAALRNLRRTMTGGGKLSMTVWRQREDNAWLHEAERCVKAIVPMTEQSDEPTCGPGPFSMAGPDMVSAQLIAAGFDRVTFERYDTAICIGRSLDEAIDFALTIGPAGEIMRLGGDEAERRRPEVVSALRDTLGAYAREGGVYTPSSSWIITARPV